MFQLDIYNNNKQFLIPISFQEQNHFQIMDINDESRLKLGW